MVGLREWSALRQCWLCELEAYVEKLDVQGDDVALVLRQWNGSLFGLFPLSAHGRADELAARADKSFMNEQFGGCWPDDHADD